MSPTPVREALAMLAREGLIRHEPQRGAIVYPPTYEDILENFELRLALEPLATRHAAGRLSPDALAQLSALAERLGACVEQAGPMREPVGYADLDRAFHQLIFDAAGRPRMAEIIASLRSAAASYAHVHRHAGFDPRRFARLQAQHLELIPALREGDGDAAERLALEHVRLTAVRPAPSHDRRSPQG